MGKPRLKWGFLGHASELMRFAADPLRPWGGPALTTSYVGFAQPTRRDVLRFPALRS